jgi:DNA-binding transcriptional LysR family regulator
MEISWIRSFTSIVDEGGFSAAARKLHIAQPALTRQIQQLEENVGTPLLWRTTRSVKPTAAGSVFLKQARDILDQLDSARIDSQRAALGEVGQLRIGYFAAGSAPFLPQIVRAYRGQYPAVRIELIEMNPARQITALESERIDMAFNRPLPASARNWLHQETVYEDHLMVALPDQHRLTRKKNLSLRDLKDESFVFFSREEAPEMIDGLTAHCRRAGFSPRIVEEIALMSTLLCHVACGVGITIIPSCVRHLGQSGVHFRSLLPALPPLPLQMVYPKDRTLPTVLGFRDLIHKQKSVIQTLMTPKSG